MQRDVFIAGLILASVMMIAAASADAQSATLAWDPNPEPDVAGYNVYRSQESGVFTSLPLNGATLVTTTSFTDSTVKNGRTYYYVVTAVRTTGQESTYSNEVEAIMGQARVTIGYSRIRPQTGGLVVPSALAVISYTNNGLLVSEAAFPTSTLIQNGRIYAELRDSVNTGIAITNPNAEPVTLNFYFTDAIGTKLFSGTTSMEANGQVTVFLSEPPFAPPAYVNLSNVRTFTFSASSPIALTGIRGFTNERREFLMTPLPVADLDTISASPFTFPYYVEGAGWETEIQLVNSTDSVLSGMVNFFPSKDTRSSDSDLVYEIPSRSEVTLRKLGLGSEQRTGWVRVTPLGGTPRPSGLLIFSFHANGVTVSQAGIHGTTEESTLRLYAETSGAFRLGTPGSIQTGFAISNPAPTAASIDLELLASSGAPMERRGTLTIPPNGQITMFLDQVPGLQDLQTPFKGFLRISGAPVAVVGLRGRYNNRRDFLITPMPAIAESALTSLSKQAFLFFADGGGYTTQFIVFSSSGEVVLP